MLMLASSCGEYRSLRRHISSEQHRRLQAHEGQEVFEATPVMLVGSRLRLDEKLW